MRASILLLCFLVSFVRPEEKTRSEFVTSAESTSISHLRHPNEYSISKTHPASFHNRFKRGLSRSSSSSRRGSYTPGSNSPPSPSRNTNRHSISHLPVRSTPPPVRVIQPRSTARPRAQSAYAPAGSSGLPRSQIDSNNFMGNLAQKVNVDVFTHNNQHLRGTNYLQKNFDKESRMGTVALAAPRQAGGTGIISGNVGKPIGYNRNGATGFSEAGLNPSYGNVLQQSLSRNAPNLNHVPFAVLTPNKKPANVFEGARHHAEGQQISAGARGNTHAMGVSKTPCSNCEQQLKTSGFPSGVGYPSGPQNVNTRNFAIPESSGTYANGQFRPGTRNENFHGIPPRTTVPTPMRGAGNNLGAHPNIPVTTPYTPIFQPNFVIPRRDRNDALAFPEINKMNSERNRGLGS